MVLPVALLVGSTLAWAGLEAAASPREPHAHLPRELATGLALLGVHAAGIADHVARGTAPALALGSALIVAGVALRLAAIRALGAGFVSATVAPARAVRRGPYRWLRHPSEVGLVLAAAGGAALVGSVLALAIAVAVLAPLSLARCAAEDRALACCVSAGGGASPARGRTPRSGSG